MAADIPEPYASALNREFIAGETAVWWGEDGERFEIHRPSVAARVLAPVIAALIALGGAVYSGDWTLTSGALLLCMIWTYFALEEPRSIFYVLTDHRLFVLKEHRKAVAVEFLRRAQIGEIWFSTQSEIVCLAYSTPDGRRSRVLRLRGLCEPRDATRLLKSWRLKA